MHYISMAQGIMMNKTICKCYKQLLFQLDNQLDLHEITFIFTKNALLVEQCIVMHCHSIRDGKCTTLEPNENFQYVIIVINVKS